MDAPSAAPVPTCCVICSINCGLTVRTEGRRLVSIRGDRNHPKSRGYLCEKAQGLDLYQNGARLTSPLRRRPDGTFEEVDWDTAIREVAARLAAVRDAHGGRSIFYYGGGAQGNHLGGAHGRALRAALGSVYTSNALAQEKTGEFWVDGQLFGKARCHTAPDFEHAEVAVFVGKNPWQSHGFPRARVLLKEIAKDPARKLVVIDPRRSETARLADIHLQVRPGGDAWLLAAMVATLLREGLVRTDWLAEHTLGLEELTALFADVDIPAYCARAGVLQERAQAAARLIAGARGVSILEDLGIQQSLHSTLSSWLEKLLYLLVGSFGKKGGMNIHSTFASLGGGAGGRRDGSPVGGHRLIGGLVPCNVIADEILCDHPARFRAMIVESANPAYSIADTPRFVEALCALDFVVVIDVAMTETAVHADYVLPAASQYEKWETTFFNLEFPDNAIQLRRPLFEPLPGTLPEPEIHARLVRALGALDGMDLGPLHEAAQQGLDAYAMAFAMFLGTRREAMGLAPTLLYETMGPLLPEGARAVGVLWALAQQVAMTNPDGVRRAGLEGDGPALGNALFRALLDSPSGRVFASDDEGATFRRVETPDKRVRLVVPELVDELRSLSSGEPAVEETYPFILSAGERRSDTANALIREPAWQTETGSLRMTPEDAARLGLASGELARITTKRGTAVAPVEITDTLQAGHVSLPNGHGFRVDGRGPSRGAAPNDLTSSAERDPIAGTPWHKHVRARIERAEGPGGAVSA